jgi:hypothetical protein
MRYPKNIDMKVFDAPQEKLFIVSIGGFVEVEAFDGEDAKELARDMRISEIHNLDIDV